MPSDTRPMPFGPRSLRLLLLLGAALLSAAVAQDLPDAAAEALARGQRAASQAIVTYTSHAPDHPLWEEAIDAGLEAQRAAPDHPAPRRFLGQAYLTVGWYSRAWDAWQAYLDRGGAVDASVARQLLEVARWMGVNTYDRGRPEQAVPYLETVVRFAPDDLAANERLARHTLRTQGPLAALPYLEALRGRVPSLEPELAHARRIVRHGDLAAGAYAQGLEALASGNDAQAFATFDEAAQGRPEFLEAWLRAAEAAERLGRSEEAARRFEHVLAREPGSARALAGLGRIAFAAGRYDEAADRFRSAIEAGSERAEVHTALAESERLLGEAEQAQARAEQQQEAARAAAESQERAAEAEAMARAAEEEARPGASEGAASAGASAEDAAARAEEIAPTVEETPAAAETPQGGRGAALGGESVAQAPEPEAPVADAPEPETPAVADVPPEAAEAPAADEAPAAAEGEEAAPEAEPPAAASSPLMLVDAVAEYTGAAGNAASGVVFLSTAVPATDLSDRRDGTIHVELDVTSKSDQQPVLIQMCLVAGDIATPPACTASDLLTVTEVGSFEARVPWSDLSGVGALDLAEGIDEVMLVARYEDGSLIGTDGRVEALPMTVHVRATSAGR